MRLKTAALLGVLCLLAGSASAEITRIAPQTFSPNGEDYLTIYGSDLLGSQGTVIVFDGTFTVFEPNFATPTEIVVWVPPPVLLTEGQHSVVVQSIDAAGIRLHGPATFTVALPAPSGPPSVYVPEAGVVEEALNTEGAFVDFLVFALSAGGDDVPVTCDHASGSQFPLGRTLVQCSATDAGGTGAASFLVYVTDTAPPSILVPGDIESETSVVTFTATSVDAIDGALPVTCSPGSGSTFPVGRTTVVCKSVDGHNNTAVGSFVVHVTVGPPLLILPDDIVEEATGPAGAVVTYAVTVEGGGTAVCTPVSGSTFPLGTSVVSCTATNPNGTISGNFNVTVEDTAGPTLVVPASIATEASSSSGAVVSWTSSATDLVDGNRPVTCVPASGSLFAIGTTSVFCFATDTRGNLSDESFEVTVVEDSTPPVLTLPGDIHREAATSSGAVVTYVASALDAHDGVVPVLCSPASGSQFPIANTAVVCTAVDAAGNLATGSFHVIVEDTTPPVLTLPAGIVVEATSPAGAIVPYTATAYDAIDGVVTIHCLPQSGAQFALGTTSVACTASDFHGNAANGSFSVLVQDTTAPEILSTSASPNALWPPNHKMVDVVVTVVAVDAADSAPVAQIVSVSSNQPVNGTGDGDTAPDWQVTGPLTLKLRAERAGGNERVYSIVVEVADASGNRSVATVLVRVSASKGRAVH